MSDMTDRDNITLPREVVKLALEAFEAVMPFSTTQRELKIRAVEALRTAIAAPKQEHPGYVIGSHWLETAYSRVCAGEAEADVLRDIGLVRITDGMVETADIHAIVDRQEALRRENERLRDELRQSSIDYTRAENERLREALELAFSCHGKVLMSDPPQDAWKFNRVDEVINAALRREGT